MVGRASSVSFELTRRCDQHCAYCYNVWKQEAGYASEELGTADLQQLISRAVEESGTSRVVLTGGEPLLRADALELIEHTARCAKAVSLVTNGSQVTPALAAAFARLGNIHVQVTLLSNRREAHDALRGGPGFEATLQGAVTLREHGVPLTVCFVCTRENHGELSGVLDLALALGARSLSFNRMAPAGDGARELARLAPTVEMIEGCLAQANQIAKSGALTVSTAIPIPPCLISHERYPAVQFAFCSSATHQPNPVVDYQGNVRSCNLSAVILGNLRETSWARLSKAPYLRQFARALPPSCRSCAYATSCRGGCKEAARACGGSLVAEEPLLRDGKEQ